jgi:uncharacterized membrane protein HdeD (DUF308 family)
MIYALYVLMATSFMVTGGVYLVLWLKLRTRRSDRTLSLLSFLLAASFGFYAFEKDSARVLLIEQLVDVVLAIVVLYNLRRLLKTLPGRGTH